MRPRQTALTDELLEYLEKTFSSEDDFLKQLAVDCWNEADIPQINITGYQANFLSLLVKNVNAKNILEIGTLAGYSAIVLARAAGEDSKITTIEKNEKHYEYAIKKIKEANLASRIKAVNANAKIWLEELNENIIYDFVFIDADKSHNAAYLDLLNPHIRKGGMLIIDNALAFGFLLNSAPERNPEGTKSMLNFHKYLLNCKNYFTTLVPIGDGMLVSLKIV